MTSAYHHYYALAGPLQLPSIVIDHDRATLYDVLTLPLPTYPGSSLMTPVIRECRTPASTRKLLALQIFLEYLRFCAKIHKFWYPAKPPHAGLVEDCALVP
jgi:hypothetical protein